MGVSARWYWVTKDEDGPVCIWRNQPRVWCGEWTCDDENPVAVMDNSEFKRKFGERNIKEFKLYKVQFFAAIIEEV